MLKLISILLSIYAAFAFFISKAIGANGFIGDVVSEHPVIFLILYICFISHITITAMSLSFHRHHTHKGAVLKTWIDTPMLVSMWLVTTMSKVDSVSIHLYHHAHSDHEKDPHSPLQKGIGHALLCGVVDYTKAKSRPEAIKIKK